MKYQPNDDLFRESTMTFGEHLEELRHALFRALIGLAIGVGIGLWFGNHIVLFIQQPLVKALEEFYRERSEKRVDAAIMDWKQRGIELPFTKEQAHQLVDSGLVPDKVFIDSQILRPEAKASKAPKVESDLSLEELEKRLGLVPVLIWRPRDEESRARLQSIDVQEPFLIYMKASVLAGVLLSSPWVFYQIWMFVAAGLYPQEKHYVNIFLPFSLGLFFAGAALAFFFVFQPVLSFLLSFNSWLGIDPDPRIGAWFSFVLILPLGFGISFQLPLVMLFLERIGIVPLPVYTEKWRISIFIIVILSAILTPSDPYSMLLMAIPLTFLYFGGVMLCKYMPKNRSPYDDE